MKKSIKSLFVALSIVICTLCILDKGAIAQEEQRPDVVFVQFMTDYAINTLPQPWQHPKRIEETQEQRKERVKLIIDASFAALTTPMIVSNWEYVQGYTHEELLTATVMKMFHEIWTF